MYSFLVEVTYPRVYGYRVRAYWGSGGYEGVTRCAAASQSDMRVWARCDLAGGADASGRAGRLSCAWGQTSAHLRASTEALRRFAYASRVS